MRDLEDRLEENGGELTPEIEALFDSTSTVLAEKVDGINHVIRQFKADEAALDAEIKHFQAKKKTAQNAQKGIREYVLRQMEFAGLDRLAGQTCKVAVTTSAALEVDEDTIRAQYADQIAAAQALLPDWLRVEVKVSKTELKAAFADAADVLPVGCRRVENKSITIR